MSQVSAEAGQLGLVEQHKGPFGESGFALAAGDKAGQADGKEPQARGSYREEQCSVQLHLCAIRPVDSATACTDDPE